MSVMRSGGLFQAVNDGRLRQARYILESGLNPNLKGDQGYSVLVEALHIEDELTRDRMFRLLLKHGASVYSLDHVSGRDVLTWACKLDRSRETRLVLREGRNGLVLHRQDEVGRCALHYAVLHGNLGITELLSTEMSRFRLSVDIYDAQGFTPYLLACRKGHHQCAKVLVEIGNASTNQCDGKEFLPAEYWRMQGRRSPAFTRRHKLPDASSVSRSTPDLEHLPRRPLRADHNLLNPSYLPPQVLQPIALHIEHNSGPKFKPSSSFPENLVQQEGESGSPGRFIDLPSAAAATAGSRRVPHLSLPPISVVGLSPSPNWIPSMGPSLSSNLDVLTEPVGASSRAPSQPSKKTLAPLDRPPSPLFPPPLPRHDTEVRIRLNIGQTQNLDIPLQDDYRHPSVTEELVPMMDLLTVQRSMSYRRSVRRPAMDFRSVGHRLGLAALAFRKPVSPSAGKGRGRGRGRLRVGGKGGRNKKTKVT